MDKSINALMTALLLDGSERRLAGLTVTEDRLFGRLPPERLGEAVDFGLRAGQQAADRIIAACGHDPGAIAAMLEVRIKHNPEPARGGAVVFFSEYSQKPPTITLHDHSLSEANEMIRSHGLKDLLHLDDVAPVHLTHELYHHLEAKKSITGTAGFRIETLKIGPIRLGSKLASVEEIAADRFAMAVLQMKVPPKVLRFLTVYEHNRDYAWDLLERSQSL